MSTAFVVGGGISGLAACHYLLKSAKFSKVMHVFLRILFKCFHDSTGTSSGTKCLERNKAVE